MLRWIRNHSGAFFIWPFFLTLLATVYYSFSVVKRNTGQLWQSAIWLAAFGLVVVLIMLIPNAYVKKNLPTDLRGKAWSDMNEHEFSRCSGYGAAGLLLGTASVIVISSILGWLITVATIFFFLNKGVV